MEQPNKTRVRAAIYARFSSHNQREESIEQQVEECRSFAQRTGLTVTAVYADSAMTGRNDRRPQFRKMQSDAEHGAFDTIIAYKSNRIARNMLNAMTFEDKMQKLGVSVLYAKEEFGNNAAGRFALRTMMNVNQFYSENMAEDIKRAMLDNARKCLANGPLPYGYRAEKGVIRIEESEAELVREIYRRALNGENLTDIREDMNRRGLRTRRGEPWGKSSFQNLLTNERYTGVYIYGNVRVAGGMPTIISRDVFDAMQQYRERKGNPVGRKKSNYGMYTLTGKLFCGRCREPMVGVSGTGRHGGRYYYYVCRDQHNGGACEKKPVRRDELEIKVAIALLDYVLQPEVAQQIVDNVSEFAREFEQKTGMDTVKSELKETNRTIANIMKAIEQGIFTVTTKSRLEELEERQAKLEGTLKETEGMKNGFPTKEDLEKYIQSFKDADVNDPHTRAELFRMFLVSVYVYDDYFIATFDIGKKDFYNVKIKIDKSSQTMYNDINCDSENPASVRISSNEVYHNSIREPLNCIKLTIECTRVTVKVGL